MDGATAVFKKVDGRWLIEERRRREIGGMGYASDSHLDQLYRNARLSQFAPIPQEMILNFIFQRDFGMPRSY